MGEIRVPGGGSRPPRQQTEAAFQERVVRYAESRGWSWLHIPRSMVRGGWRTQAVGPLAKGWPDLLLVRGAEARAAELKTDTGDLSDDQRRVHRMLGRAIPVDVWRPRDWETVAAALA